MEKYRPIEKKSTEKDTFYDKASQMLSYPLIMLIFSSSFANAHFLSTNYLLHCTFFNKKLLPLEIYVHGGQADAFLLCFSVDNITSFQNITSKWQPEVKHHCPKVPYVLVATKTDLRQESEAEDAVDKEGEDDEVHYCSPLYNSKAAKAARMLKDAYREKKHSHQREAKTVASHAMGKNKNSTKNGTDVSVDVHGDGAHREHQRNTRATVSVATASAGGIASNTSSATVENSAVSGSSLYVSQDMGKRLAVKLKAASYVECSAKTLRGVDQVSLLSHLLVFAFACFLSYWI